MNKAVDLNEIRNRVRALSLPAPSQAKDKDDAWIYAVIFSIILFVGAVTGLVVSKKSHTTPAQMISPVAVEPATPGQRVVSRVDQLEKQVRTLQDRQWMLGLANNENSVIGQETADRLKTGRKYLFLDEQWRFDHMPQHLRLSEQEKKDLSEIMRR
jgi:hypothetical protein